MPLQSIIQGKYVLGCKSVVGDPRRKWEDRVYAGEIKRFDETSMIVGIVADGVGSADFGARGAQLAIDTVVENIQNSLGENIPDILETSIKAANAVVFADNENNDGDGLTTLVVAVVYRDRCFVGNVGDSRAYWIQISSQRKRGKVLQLSRDHTYYNIYGGDRNSSEAGVIVNAIGKKKEVQIDLGFHLKGDDIEYAYRLGLAGLPLQPGDTIMLCSDGLTKNSPGGQPYITANEMLDSVETEYEPDRAAIKMVSHAEGRRADDNVSVVTIQYLSRQLVSEIRSRSDHAQRMRRFTTLGSVIFIFFAVFLISLLSYKVIGDATKPTPTPVVITATYMPSPARVMRVDGSGANVMVGEFLVPETEIITNNSVVKIMTDGQNDQYGVIYWLRNSTGTLNFDVLSINPVLKSGAVYIRSGDNKAEVSFLNTKVIASVHNGNMIVELAEDDIWIYCFEGTCQLSVRGVEDAIMVDKGYKKLYDTETEKPDISILISADEIHEWNLLCNLCISDNATTPIPTVYP